MEQRIKIVWIFSIVSMLLITCGQVYWLRNQYQYMNDEQINDIYDRILQTTQQYDSIRTPQPKKVLNNANMFFYQLSKSIDLEHRTTIDEVILGALKGRELENMGGNVETLKIETRDSAKVDGQTKHTQREQWALDSIIPKERIIVMDSFKINMSDIILLPGSKSTLADLHELRRNGVAQAVIRAHREGATVMGICGGYQIMGQEVCDPDHVEGEIERLPGLGLLPVSTHMTGEKITRQIKFRLSAVARENSHLSTDGMQANLEGYEIHMGTTVPVYDAPVSPLNLLEDGGADGYFLDRTCIGTYIHGILDNPSFIDFLLEPFADKIADAGKSFDYHQFKEEQYNKLADHVRSHVDLPLIYKILTTHD